MLAECVAQVQADTLKALNIEQPDTFHHSKLQDTGIEVYTRLPKGCAAPIYEEKGLTIRHLKPPGGTDILLAAVHLGSKLHQRSESQAFGCTELSASIRAQEQAMGHRRTLLVGDFNMDPFEAGIVGASGLNAVMDRRIAERGERKVKGKSHPFFYNPMWGHFGDGSRGPPGTYYYQGAEQVMYFWHILDQVLIRPELLDRFKNEDLHILEAVGKTSFLNKKGRPEKTVASDHLPILFKLNL